MKYSDNWNTIFGYTPPPLAVRPLVVDMCHALLRIVSACSGGRFGHIKNIKPYIASRRDGLGSYNFPLLIPHRFWICYL